MPSPAKLVFGPVPPGAPVLIVGQLRHLQALQFKGDVATRVGSEVNEEVWTAALATLQSSEVCSLVLRSAVAALTQHCSRHAAPARPAHLSRLVRQLSLPLQENNAIVVVCEKNEMYASACAVGRVFPLFSRRQGDKEATVTVTLDFQLLPPTAPPTKGSPDEVGWTAPTGVLAETTVSPEELEVLRNAVESVRFTAQIVDMPTNFMNVDHFLEKVAEVGKELYITPKIIRGKELKEQGFGGIYGVGKAASVPPALAVLSWCPPEATETVAWVGKGIVYDTGGLSLKSKTGMPGMKRDCGGAAGILGAFLAVVRAGFQQNLHAVFCLAENSVGPEATRPDDIHTLYSGFTVEINNTDAEGRLVLADGVAYAQKVLKADLILDMATLTGAQGIALGKYHAAVLGNSDQWEKAACVAGRASGDLTFPVPYAPELHFTEFSSALADMKNSVADRNNAQVSCAGLFIGAQLGRDFPGVWLHVDMASPSHCGERATGYGVALLSILFGDRTKSKLLQALAPGVAQSSVKITAPLPPKRERKP